MTIEECYEQMGGDFSQMKSRIPSVNLISKFVAKFLDDGSFSELCSAMEEGQRAKAFNAAHTLKGVCGNLSLEKALASSSRLTELLRPEADAVSEEAYAVMEEVKRDYETVISTIKEFMSAD